MLAFSWNRHLYIFQVTKGAGQTPGLTPTRLSPDRKPVPEANGKSPKLDFIKIGDWISREGIVGIQWVRPQVMRHGSDVFALIRATLIQCRC
jgi:hypothetical protein